MKRFIRSVVVFAVAFGISRYFSTRRNCEEA